MGSASPPAPKSRVGPIPRTDPYQAPYFFPTPMSPDASGYVGRVLMERTLNYTRQPSGTTSPQSNNEPVQDMLSSPPLDIERVPEDMHTPREEESNSNSQEALGGRKASRRYRGLRRPTSWESEALTIASSSNDSSHLPSSPGPQPKRSIIWRLVLLYMFY